MPIRILLAAGAVLAAAGAVPAGVPAGELRVDPAAGCADDGSARAFCTLAAAIRAAEASPGPDVVHLAAGSVVTLRETDHVHEGGNALPAIAGELVIEGHGATIERSADPGTPELRLLRVAESGDLTLRDLTLRNGATPRGFDGAAVWSAGRLTLERCVVEGNVSGDDGGGLRNDGVARITDSVLRRNAARWRGGVGGAIQNAEQLGPAELTLERSSLVDNDAAAVGGALWAEGTVRIVNSTLSGNRAGSRAGAIQSYGALEIDSSTITDNRAEVTAGGIHSFGTASLANSVVAGNLAMISADCHGRFATLGHNLLGTLYECELVGEAPGDRTGVTPGLGPLELVAAMPVHRPLAGGPAAEGGPAGGACPAVDQLGRPRPGPGSASRCDVGAVELGTGLPPEVAPSAEPARAAEPLLAAEPLTSAESAGAVSVAEPAPAAGGSAGEAALRAIAELGGQIDRRTGEGGAERVLITTDGRWRGGDEGLRHLAEIPGLYKLRIGGQVTDAGLVHIGRIEGLEALDLHLPRVTDQGVAHLRGLSGLERLNLTYTRVTDAGLEHLVGMKRLKWLGLAYTRVTAQGVERLQSRLPDTVIEGDFRSK